MSSFLYNVIFLIGLIVVAKWIITWVFFGGFYLWCYLWNHQNRWVVLCWAILNLIALSAIAALLFVVVGSVFHPDMDETTLYNKLWRVFIGTMGLGIFGAILVWWEDNKFWKRLDAKKEPDKE